MANNVEHSNDPTAYPQGHHIKIFPTTTDRHKSQQQVKVGAYAKSLVKKNYVFNPNKATEDFDYAPSRPGKCSISVSYTPAVASPIHQPDFAYRITENIDLTMYEPSLLTV
jgi:hypothetical protein